MWETTLNSHDFAWEWNFHRLLEGSFVYRSGRNAETAIKIAAVRVEWSVGCYKGNMLFRGTDRSHVKEETKRVWFIEWFRMRIGEQVRLVAAPNKELRSWHLFYNEQILLIYFVIELFVITNFIVLSSYLCLWIKLKIRSININLFWILLTPPPLWPKT